MKDKINFVSYLHPFYFSGGGEVVNREIISRLLSEGYDVRIISARPFRPRFFLNPDLNIFADIDNNSAFPFKSNLFRIPLIFLKFLSRKTKFVHLSNAYSDICNKSYLPCNGNTQKNLCPIDGGLCYAYSNRSLFLVNKASLNVFVSPLHKKIFRKITGRKFKNPFILGPLIDTNIFKNENLQRDIKSLFVGVISEAKGINSLSKYSIDNDLTLVGNIEEGLTLNFGKHIPHLPYNQVPNIMNRAMKFVYLPRWPEPQGRVVHEAALCGCELITNGMVGATSFNFNISDPNKYKDFIKELILEIDKL